MPGMMSAALRVRGLSSLRRPGIEGRPSHHQTCSPCGSGPATCRRRHSGSGTDFVLPTMRRARAATDPSGTDFAALQSAGYRFCLTHAPTSSTMTLPPMVEATSCRKTSRPARYWRISFLFRDLGEGTLGDHSHLRLLAGDHDISQTYRPTGNFVVIIARPH
jgi:hypothetical protein